MHTCTSNIDKNDCFFFGGGGGREGCFCNHFVFQLLLFVAGAFHQRNNSFVVVSFIMSTRWSIVIVYYPTQKLDFWVTFMKKKYLIVCMLDHVFLGWLDHRCMYFTPIRYKLLWTTNPIVACYRVIVRVFSLSEQLFRPSRTWDK